MLVVAPVLVLLVAILVTIVNFLIAHFCIVQSRLSWLAPSQSGTSQQANGFAQRPNPWCVEQYAPFVMSIKYNTH